MKKIVIAEIKHETNSFSPNKTGLAEFKARNCLFGDDIPGFFRGVKNEMGAFLGYFEPLDQYELIPAVAMNAQPGGIVTAEAFEKAKSSLLEAVRQSKPDGILLALHGAMVTENCPDGEGRLLEALREEVGENVPVIASLDLHCNLTDKMVNNATALFAYDYYPHTDTFETGLRAAQCMDKTLMGEINPKMAYKALPILTPLLPTGEECIKPFVQKVQAMRGKKGIINANIVHGFFPADIYDVSMSTLIVADGNYSLAEKEAEKLARELWEKRNTFEHRSYTVEEALNDARKNGQYPVVFADTADNPGSGASADGTHLLRRLIEKDVKNAAFAIICDPETVAQAQNAGEGADIFVSLGGRVCPDLAGEPIKCNARVVTLSNGEFTNRDYNPGVRGNLGKSAVLDINGIKVIVTSLRSQPWDREAFRCCSINPEEYEIIVVKSSVHFRASFGKKAAKIYDIDLPALGRGNPKAMNYKNIRRPIYPLDEI